jgi:hypothetical protein
MVGSCGLPERINKLFGTKIMALHTYVVYDSVNVAAAHSRRIEEASVVC